MRKAGCYALYKGDRFIDLGTLKELAIQTGISLSTLKFYTSKVYEMRSIKKNSNNLKILIKIEEIENDTDSSD